MPFHLNNLPKRTVKPREKGITLALDKGLSVRQVEDFCESSSPFTDLVKLGWGTSYVTNNLRQKLEIYGHYEIPVFLGGTLFEAYILRDQLDCYIKLLEKFEIRHIEVSNGTIWLSEGRKIEIIRRLSDSFIVLSEIGSKNPNDIIPPYKWVNMIRKEIEAGAWKIICEARESGTVGVFRPNGEVRSGLIEEISDQISQDKLIFEAPLKEQQVWFIRKFGSNANLGNIATSEVIPLETLRLGLRSDTLLDFYSVSDEKTDGIYDEGGRSEVSHRQNNSKNVTNR